MIISDQDKLNLLTAKNLNFALAHMLRPCRAKPIKNQLSSALARKLIHIWINLNIITDDCAFSLSHQELPQILVLCFL